MTKQSAGPPALPAGNAKPKRRWKWLRITVGIIAAGYLAMRILGSYNSPDLELVRRDLFDAARDGRVLEITNTGKKPLKIVGMNDRPDCSISRLSFVEDAPLFPSAMKIGDKIILSSRQIVRAKIETDQGSNTFSFNR